MTSQSVRTKLGGFLLLAVVALPFVLEATPSQAGLANTPYAKCTRGPAGDGSCMGYFSAFRSSANPKAFASFQSTTLFGFSSFLAELNGGAQYSCSVPNGSPLMAQFQSTAVAASLGSEFMIAWDQSGNCTQFLSFISSKDKPGSTPCPSGGCQ